jgi:hypothetical protein
MVWTNWLIWAPVLFMQNFANTFTSRARNSASLKRHIAASLLSNGVWITNQALILGTFLNDISGKNGRPVQLLTCALYGVFTMFGSVSAHWIGLRTEHGKSRVGAYHETT